MAILLLPFFPSLNLLSDTKIKQGNDKLNILPSLSIERENVFIWIGIPKVHVFCLHNAEFWYLTVKSINIFTQVEAYSPV